MSWVHRPERFLKGALHLSHAVFHFKQAIAAPVFWAGFAEGRKEANPREFCPNFVMQVPGDALAFFVDESLSGQEACESDSDDEPDQESCPSQCESADGAEEQGGLREGRGNPDGNLCRIGMPIAGRSPCLNLKSVIAGGEVLEGGSTHRGWLGPLGVEPRKTMPEYGLVEMTKIRCGEQDFHPPSARWEGLLCAESFER